MNDFAHKNSETRVKHQRKFRILFVSALVLCAICLCIFAGCASDESEESSTTDQTENTKSSERTEATMPNTADITTFNDFGIALFKQIDDSTSNTCISPLSVEYALGMTANGAEGQTRVQMEEVLGASVDGINDMLSDLRTTTQEQTDESASTQTEPDDEETITEPLHIANSLWIKDSFDVKDSFLQTNTKYYDAGIFQTPFDSSTVNDINQWVNDNTDGMINRIVDELSPNGVMYLINALAFEATWVNPYDPSDVYTGTFTTEDNKEQEVDFMASIEDTYLEGAGATGFIKPYMQGSYAFAALLPDEGTGVDELIENLDSQTLEDLLNNTQQTRIDAKMPKFESDFETDLDDTLENMGMTDAFAENTADFTGIADTTEPLFIGSVAHKTYINVDEAGTKAGAATSVGIVVTGMPPEPGKTVYLDRPFVYLIIDQATDAVIFIGTVRDIG